MPRGCTAAKVGNQIVDKREDGSSGVPCISPACARGDIEVTESPLHPDDYLCLTARRERKCASAAWTKFSTLIQLQQPMCKATKVSLLDVMFGQHGCAKSEDLCRSVLARLGTLMVTCGFQRGPRIGKKEPFDLLCGGQPGPDPEGRNRKACEWVGKDLKDSPTMFTIMQSLQCECRTLVTDASRSNSVLQVSSDGRYVAKQIKPAEVPVLRELLTKFDLLPLMSKWVYLDNYRRIVVMPNLNDPVGRGLSARFMLPKQCPENFWVPASINAASWDVKALPSKSAQRGRFLAHLIRHRIRLREWHRFHRIMSLLGQTLAFMKTENLVDYSLLFSLFTVEGDPPGPGGPNCEPSVDMVAPQRECLISPSCTPTSADITGSTHFTSAAGGRCEALCVTVIDYLMKYGVARWFESMIKDHKWGSYAEKTMGLWGCLSDLTNPACNKYLEEGCRALECDANVRPQEWSWCNGTEKESVSDSIDNGMVMPLPPNVWVKQGCVPDPDWRSAGEDEVACIEYEGIPPAMEDLHTRSKDGRTPLEGCCVDTVDGVTRYVVSPPFPKAAPSVSPKIPKRAWTSNGCVPDESWKEDQDEDCIDYEGLPFAEKDLEPKGSSGRSPAEACCLEITCNEVRYYDPDRVRSSANCKGTRWESLPLPPTFGRK